MKLQEFLYLADTHIKNRTWTNNMQLCGDAYTALLKLSAAVTTDVCVVGGDWFDSNRPTSEDLVNTAVFFSHFKKVYYIQGNHDNIRPSFFEALNLEEYEQDLQYPSATPTKFIELSSVIIPFHTYSDSYIAGVPWTASSDSLKASIKNICDTFSHIWQQNRHSKLYLILHTSFKHLLNFEGAYKLDADFIKTVVADMPVNILVGDIHTRDTLQLTPVSYIHSCGSLYPLSFDKAQEAHFVSLISTDTGVITDVPVDVRKYYSFFSDTREAINQHLKDIIESDQLCLKPFVRICVPSGEDIHIMESSYPGAVIQVITNDAVDTALQHSTTIADSYTIDQAISDEVKASNLSDDIEMMACALAHSADPLAEIEKWLKFWNVERLNEE